ncbi:hypothetical protein NPIL_416261 [Nephila pilipes]|uniref:Uncharacterized protein n=1 Tax=Nephila pilipes TaxID=299642 RepID=A0A8X6PJL1_NEPPI|nr:hypothetical protein NPIL_416261 [Nephila pilipes]
MPAEPSSLSQSALLTHPRIQDTRNGGTSILMGQAQCSASWTSAGPWVGRPKTMGVAISGAFPGPLDGRLRAPTSAVISYA